LETEIESANSEDFKQQLSSLLALESMLNKQVCAGQPCCCFIVMPVPLSVQNLATVGGELVDQWKAERDAARYQLSTPTGYI
jgi:hypothetical protein